MISGLKQLLNGKSLSWRLQLLIFLASVIAVISRRPDVLLNPQFWAEDGQMWFAQAYNLGWLHALSLPFGGYLNSLPRLVAAAALWIPLRFAPLLMNCVGITLQALPANILLSARCSSWGSLSLRLLYSAIYLALPNSWEIHVNMTDAHFHLALVAFLLATGLPATNWQWKSFDIGVLLLSGLTGPWSLVLLPLVLIFWWMRRYRWSLIVAGITAFCAVTQAVMLLSSSGAAARPSPHLGATPMLLLRILAGDIFLGSLFGGNHFGANGPRLAIVLIALLGASVLFHTLLKAPVELKLFILFCCALLAASLNRPLIITSLPQWRALLVIPGARYWFYPMLAFLWSLVWCASEDRNKFFQKLGVLALLLMMIGVVRDWKYSPYKDMNFREYARKFNTAPSGTWVEIPINPAPVVFSDGGKLHSIEWAVRLKKK